MISLMSFYTTCIVRIQVMTLSFSFNCYSLILWHITPPHLYFSNHGVSFFCFKLYWNLFIVNHDDKEMWSLSLMSYTIIIKLIGQQHRKNFFSKDIPSVSFNFYFAFLFPFLFVGLLQASLSSLTTLTYHFYHSSG